MKLGKDYEPSKDPFWIDMKREIEAEQNFEANKDEQIKYLENRVKQLEEHVQGVSILLVSQFMKNNDELRVSQEFLLDYSLHDFEIKKWVDFASTDTIFKLVRKNPF